MSSMRSQRTDKNPDDADANEHKAYEHAVAKAERLLMLRASNLSQLEPSQLDWRSKLKLGLESWWGEGNSVEFAFGVKSILPPGACAFDCKATAVQLRPVRFGHIHELYRHWCGDRCRCASRD